MENYLDKSVLDEKIEQIVLPEKCDAPAASIIIVTYNTARETLETIFNILSTSDNVYEILLIDNNARSDLEKLTTKYKLTYIKLKTNFGLTIGRNIGIMKARGRILIFLDDDAIPGERYVDQHIKAYQERGICALRGKCLPLTNSVFNYFAAHYDLGDDIMPYGINLEGNSSFTREILLGVGGFNPNLKGSGGHEGLEISNRIIKKTQRLDSIIYYPHAIIHHDYSKSFTHFLKKQVRHQNHLRFLTENDHEFLDFFTGYVTGTKLKSNKPDLTTQIKIRLIVYLSRYTLMLNSIFNVIADKIKIQESSKE